MRARCVRAIQILTVLLPLAAPAARAVETTYQVANQLRSYYDSKLRESLVDDRFDVFVGHGPYSAGMEFLSHSPSEFSRLDPDKFGPPRQGIRKRWVEAQIDHFDLRAGNVYATFGRGLALQVYEDQVVSFDNVLDGAWGKADFGPTHFQLIGGTNAYGLQTLVLKGAHFLYDLPAGMHAGFNGVWEDTRGTAGQGRTGGDRLYGTQADGSFLGRLDLYGEYVMRDQRNATGGPARVDQGGVEVRVPQGHAGYASGSLGLGRVQLLGEYKDLLRYQLPTFTREDGTPLAFVSPPTAVRQHTTTLLNRATHVRNINLNDERGGLLETYITVTESTHLTGSWSRSEAHHSMHSSEFTPPDVFHGTRFPAWELYGEVEQGLGGPADVILRLDESRETVNEGGVPTFFDRITGGGSLLLPLTGVWSIDTTWESQKGQESNRAFVPDFFNYIAYYNHALTFTLSRAPGMSWAVTSEWTTDTREARRSWLWGEFNVRIADRHQLSLGGGRLRGGQVCSGGVCKIVDPFEGVRVEFLSTF